MFDEPLSPELVLVAPPELANHARELLPEIPPVLPARSASIRLGPGFLVFFAACIAGTVGPFMLALLARAHH